MPDDQRIARVEEVILQVCYMERPGTSANETEQRHRKQMKYTNFNVKMSKIDLYTQNYSERRPKHFVVFSGLQKSYTVTATPKISSANCF